MKENTTMLEATDQTEERFKTTMREEKGWRNICLNGVETLQCEYFVSTYKIIHELHCKTKKPFKLISKDLAQEKVENVEFKLIEATPQQLAKCRKAGIPSFVLKKDGKFYWARIPKKMNLLSATMLGTHQCAQLHGVCKRLSPAEDSEGGCAKVREGSSGIEKYPWITLGYETFNTKVECFVVIHCQNYEACPPHKKKSFNELNRLKLSIAQLVWDDVEDMNDVLERKKKQSKYFQDKR